MEEVVGAGTVLGVGLDREGVRQSLFGELAEETFAAGTTCMICIMSFAESSSNFSSSVCFLAICVYPSFLFEVHISCFLQIVVPVTVALC